MVKFNKRRKKIFILVIFEEREKELILKILKKIFNKNFRKKPVSISISIQQINNMDVRCEIKICNNVSEHSEYYIFK